MFRFAALISFILYHVIHMIIHKGVKPRLGEDKTGDIFHAHSGEMFGPEGSRDLNRTMFDGWKPVAIAVGIFLLFVLILGIAAGISQAGDQ